MIICTRGSSKFKFNTLSDYMQWEAIECKKLGFDYGMYVNYMHQFTNEYLDSCLNEIEYANIGSK